MSNTRQWPNLAAHSMTIGGKHTFRDWYMIPSEIPVFAPPTPKTNYIDVPASNGVLDYTEELTGAVLYNNRTGSFNFTVLEDEDWSWAEAYSAILNFTQGKRFNCILDDDPTHFYTGRFAINTWKSSKQYSRIVLDYNVDPYRRSVDTTGEYDWLWDDLFNNVFYYGTFSVNGTKARNLINPSAVEVTPKFICSAVMSVSFNNVTYVLPAGTTEAPGFTLSTGDNRMTFTGTGNVIVDYPVEVLL